MVDYLKNGIALVVAVGAFVAKPDLLGGLKAGGTILDIARKMTANPPPGMARLTEDLTGSARSVFDGFERDLPADAGLLFEQMVEASLPDPRDIVAARMQAGPVVDGMLTGLTDPEHRRPPMPDLFRAITEPAFDRLLAETAFVEGLTPAFMARTLGSLWQIEATVTENNALLVEMKAQIAELRRRSDSAPQAALDDLRDIAAELAHPKPHRADWPALVTYILDKVREQAETIARLDAAPLGDSDALRQDVAALLSARRYRDAEAALDAALEAEAASGALERHLERVAFALTSKAEVALLQNRIEDAVELFTRAADSFAALDPLAPAKRRLEAGWLLERHGRRFGNRASVAAGEMARSMIDGLDPATAPNAWVEAHRLLGEAELEIAQRAGGLQGLIHLGKSTNAFAEAARHPDGFAGPAAYAVTLAQHGRVCAIFAHRYPGEHAEPNRALARNAFVSALRILGTHGDLSDRAWVTTELAQAMLAEGRVQPGDAALPWLEAAEKAADAALVLFERIERQPVHPDDARHRTDAFNRSKAMTVQAEARLLRAVTLFNSGPPDIAALARLDRCATETAATYATACTDFPEDTAPVTWASNMLNRADALDWLVLTRRITGGAAGAFSDCLATRQDALRILTRETHPAEWANAQLRNAETRMRFTDTSDCPDPQAELRRGLADAKAAAETYRTLALEAPHRDARAMAAAIEARLDPTQDRS